MTKIKVKQNNLKLKTRFQISPYLFIAPFFILFILFSAFPIFYSLQLSFYSWNGIKEMSFVGFENYKFLLFKDYNFWRSIGNTLLVTVTSGIAQHITALAFAFILNQGLVKAKNFFKGVFFLPYITSSAAITIIFVAIFSDHGIFNSFGQYLNDIEFLTLFGDFKFPIKFIRSSLMTLSVSLLIFWKWTGWNILLYLAGLQTINSEIYDAAKIDGADWSQIFWKITIPLIKPMIFFATSMTIIYGMQIFDEAVILDGIDNSINYTLTSAVYMYAYAFKWGSFGTSTALSYLLCLVIFVISFGYRKAMNNGEV